MSSFVSHTNAAKQGKITSISDAHAEVRKKMREHLFPQEIIDMIFEIVYSYSRKKYLISIDSRYGKRSIWWNPSERLRKLCGERGAIQNKYFDSWSLFRSYVLCEHECIMRNPHFIISFEEEDQIDREFYIFRCGELNCSECMLENFPCGCLASYNSKICGLWDIRDEPSLSSVANQLDLQYPGWRDSLYI